MFAYLKQSTASQTKIVGPFIDDTDFKTVETGLTINNTDVKLSANGGTAFNKTSGGGTHIANGMYALTFDATDSATVGELNGSIKVSGALVVTFKFWIYEEAVYDDLIGASAPGYLKPTTAARTLDVTAGGTAGIDWANVESPTTALDLSGTDIQLCDTTTTVTNEVTADVTKISGDATAADNLELDYDGTGYAKANSTIGTTTTNTDMRGTDSAATASNLAIVDTNVDAILVDTGTSIPASISALNDISVADILTTQMTEAYAADGTAPTLAQALFLIQQSIGDFSIAGTTITTKKLDGSTTAATYTLDDGTDPTSRTRAT